MLRTCLPYLLLFLMAVLAGIAVLTGTLNFTFPYDDSFILARNAAILAHDIKDTAYGTSAFAGSSSTAHLVITAAFNFITSPLKALMLSAIFCFFLYAAGALYAVRQLLPARYQLAGLVPFFALATIPINLFNGLDTTLAMAAVVWMLALATGQAPRQLLLLALVAGISPHIRSELAALAGLLLLYKVMELHKTKWLFLLPILFFISWLVPELLYVWTSGGLMPNTLQAKAAFYAQTCSQPLYRLTHVGESVLMLLLINMPASLFILHVLRERLLQVIFIFSLIFISAYALFLPTGLSIESNGPRYTTLLSAAWAFAFVFALGKNTAMLGRRLTLSCIVAIMLSVVFLSVVAVPQYVDNNRMLRDAADWANNNIPQGSRIILHDAGYFAYATDGKDFILTDAIGLKTTWVTPIHKAITAPSCGEGRAKAIAEIARQSQPQWAIFTSYTSPEAFWQGLELAGYRLVLRHQAENTYIYELQPLSNLNP